MERLTKLANYFGTDKGTTCGDSHRYTEIYQSYFEKYENPVILEIGVFHGSSIKMINAFYDGQCEIYACDIDSNCENYIRDLPNVHFIQLELGNMESMKNVKSCLGNIKFDMIIEDASHIWEHQMYSLYMYHDMLKENGIYILEDLQTSRQYEDLRISPLAFLALAQPSGLIEPEYEDKILKDIEDIKIFSVRNEKTQAMRDFYRGRSITSILTFKYNG